MPNVKLIIAYDGTHYLGWKKTKMGPSIEESIEQVLEKFLQERISLQGTSRTDAGVHARGQLVQFSTSRQDLSRLKKSLNSMLPKDISVYDLKIIDNFIKPKSKIYHYYICNSLIQLPWLRNYSWHIRKPLDQDAMEAAAKQIVGIRDFAAFCNVSEEEPYEDTTRNLMRLDVKMLANNRYAIEIEGDSFLYKMARNIVGTLCDIGTGKIKEDKLGNLIKNKDRKKLGITAPAHGLFLEKIITPNQSEF